MKFLLPALPIGASTTYVGAKMTFTPPPPRLPPYPKAALEAGTGGSCVRLTNRSEGLVYVPLTDESPAEAAPMGLTNNNKESRARVLALH